MARQNALRTAFLTLTLAFSSAVASGQVSQGSISGTVVDAAGAVLPGASVSAKSEATNQTASTTTDAAGLFRLSLLPVGSYTVAITKPGFDKLMLADVGVAAGVDNGLQTLSLKVGSVTSTIEVSAAGALVETSEAQVSATFTGTLLDNFPGIQGNEGLDFLALTLPGVANVRDISYANTNGPGFSVNGIRGRNNDQQIDGQNNNDNSVGGPSLSLSMIEFVQEYQITTNNFSPEYGRNSGSVVNVITKSGTNNWHGTLFGSESNSDLNTLSNTQKYFEDLTKVPHFNDEFTGGGIGGPIWKDHVFYFGGFDDEIISQNTVYSTGDLTPDPTGLGQLSTCFPNSPSVAALKAYGPFGVTGGDPIPVGTPKTFNLTGSIVPGMSPCPVQFSGVQRTLSTGYREYDFIQRADVVISQHDRFYGRYLYNHSNSPNGDPFSTAASGYPANTPALSQDAGGSWTHLFSSRMSNEVRLSYGRLNVEFGGNDIGNTVPDVGNLTQALAHVGFSGTLGGSALLGFGPAGNAPQGRIVNTYQLQDNWNRVVGRHQLKAGVNYTHQRSPNVLLSSINGQFNFGKFTNASATAITNASCSVAPGKTLSNVSAFACDIPSNVKIAVGPPTLNFVENDTFLYFGDDYKIRPNLTLNLGLTWSYYGQPANLLHDLTVAQQTGSSPFWNPSLPLSVTTFPKIPAPKNSYGPSAGFAWSPHWANWLTGNGNQTVVRGGYRLAYDPPFYNIYLNIAGSAPNVLLQTLTGAKANMNPLPAMPFGPAVRTELAPFVTLGVFDPRTFDETSITPNFGPDRVHSWSFGVQRELSSHAAFEIRYVGNHGQNLFQGIDANPYIQGIANTFPNLLPAGVTPCSAANAVVPEAIGREYCNLGLVKERTNHGYSDYDGLQAEFRTTRLFNQLTMRTSYTFSKTTDNVDEIYSTFAGGDSNSLAQDQLNFTGAEHGLSGLNFPNIWTTSFVEEIPFMRAQSGTLGHVLGGWGLSGTYILSSGQPYTPIQDALDCFSQPVAPCTQTQGTPTDKFPFDYAFMSGLGGGIDESARPFVGNLNAPVTSIGMFAADACNYVGVGCMLPATTLLNFAQVNTGVANPATVTREQVRLIVNAPEAEAVFGTPFGNAARNSLTDAKTNILNLGIFKESKVSERATLRFTTTMLNALNHPNFSSIDPFLDDAGSYSEGTGFGIPQVTSGGNRTIKFALKVIF